MRKAAMIAVLVMFAGCFEITDTDIPQKAMLNLYEPFIHEETQSYHIQYSRQRRVYNIQCPLNTHPLIEIEPPLLSDSIHRLHGHVALNEHKSSFSALHNVYWAENLSNMLQRHFARIKPMDCFRLTRIKSNNADYRLISVVHDFSIFTDAKGHALKGVVDMEFWLIRPNAQPNWQTKRWRLVAQEPVKARYDTQAAIHSLSIAFSRILESNFIEMLNHL